MARPNSKYFASVIAKLIAAKRQEHIAIDQNFKMQLREELIQRATGVSVERESFDWGEFFSRWKYPLTLVPSALLLMLVVSQVMKLPVVMESEVSVPMVSSQQETSSASSDQQKTESAVEDAGLLQDSVLTQTEPAKPRIKTFPGALVMPKKVPAVKEPVSQVAAPTLDMNQSIQQSVSAPQPVVSEPSSGTTASQDLAKKVVDNIMPVVSTLIPDRTGEPDANTTSSFKEIKTTTDSVSAGTSAVSQNQPAQSDTTLSQTSDAGGVTSSTTDAASQNQSSAISGDTGGGQTSTTGVVVQPEQPQVSAPAVQISNTAPTTTLPKIVDPVLTMNKVPAVQESLRSFPVFYQFDMPEADRAGFERVVLPNSIDSKDVSHAVVIQKDGGVIELQVFFKDSTSVTSYYKKNAKTGAWDSVEYVTRYYYDNSLQYSTDVRYLVPNR